MAGDLKNSKDTPMMLTGIALIALLHCALWFAHYNQTALGESPALDNRQTLELAQAMAGGKLAEEPFHRAPLYPFILSLFLTVGLPFELLPLVARWLNALALAATAASASLIALRIWGKLACGWAAGLLVALNPVLIFFAGDAFDILFATAAFSVALFFLIIWQKNPTLKGSLIIGIIFAIGAALRSHLLPLALLWPIAAFFLAKRNRLPQLFLPAGPLILSFLLLGLANFQVSGDFRLMPWQGAYNLWAGNGPNANGRIYAQEMRVDFGNGYDNPAKLESIALYQKETGAEPPHPIDKMNAYWKEKTFKHIAEHPAEWLGLMLRKAYYFLNSYEQYDNKTYGFHKQQHFLLRWNPIHWGALLICAVAGALIALRDSRRRRVAITLILLFAIYAAGTILFYTSNRFRLPMVPLLAILSVGAMALPHSWSLAGKAWKGTLLGSLLLTAVLTYSGFFNARDTNTWAEDSALLANAALRTGRDREALRWAKQALVERPHRSDMLEVSAQANFNLWALANPPIRLDAATARDLLQQANKAAASDPDFAAIAGIYLWKLGHRSDANALWNIHAPEIALARLCLIWTGQEELPSLESLQAYAQDDHYELLCAGVEAKQLKAKPTELKIAMDGIFEPVKE